MNKGYQIVLVSQKSNKKWLLTFPHCLYLDAAGITVPQIASGSLHTSNAWLRMHKLAFSRPDFKIMDDKCSPERQSSDVTIDPMKKYVTTDTNPFTYLLSYEKKYGAKFIAEKDHVLLYQTSSSWQTFFYQKNFPNITHPLSVSFLRQKVKGSRHKYYFRVHTIIHGEFKLYYTVIPDSTNPKHYAEIFKQSLERDENPLEQKEVIQAFMQNNEAVARYFEQHSPLINPEQ